MPCRLRRIHQKQELSPPAYPADCRNVLRHAQNIGHVRHDDQSRSGRDSALHILRLYSAVSIRRNQRQRDDTAARKLRQRTQNRVMFNERGNHMVARPECAVYRHIERIGRVHRKRNPRRILFPNQLRNLLAAFFNDSPRRQ